MGLGAAAPVNGNESTQIHVKVSDKESDYEMQMDIDHRLCSAFTFFSHDRRLQ
jgi:hypothetical protein